MSLKLKSPEPTQELTPNYIRSAIEKLKPEERLEWMMALHRIQVGLLIRMNEES